MWMTSKDLCVLRGAADVCDELERAEANQHLTLDDRISLLRTRNAELVRDQYLKTEHLEWKKMFDAELAEEYNKVFN